MARRSGLQQFSQTHYRTILSLLDVGVIVFDRHGSIEAINDTALRLAGFQSLDEIPDRNILAIRDRFDLRDPEGRLLRDTARPVAMLLRGEQVRDYEVEVRRRGSGHPHWISYSGAVERATTGEISRIIMTMQDVTDRETAALALRATEQRLRAALAHVPLLLFHQDRDLRYTWIHNPRLSDAAIRLALGARDADLMPPDEAARVSALKRRVIEEGITIREIIETVSTDAHGDERVAYLDNSFLPLRDTSGEIVGLTGAVLDITATQRSLRDQELLARAGAILGSSLDYHEALNGIAGLLVPDFADWCVVSTLEGEWIERRVIVHADPDKEAILRRVPQRYRYDPARQWGIPAVLRTGQPTLRRYATVPEEQLDDEMAARIRDTLHQMGVRSELIVPLQASGSVLGVIYVGLSRPRKRYDESDVALLQVIADRAAVAIEHTRVYAAERAARQAAERAAERASQLQELSAALVAAPSLTTVGQVLVERGLVTLSARAGIVAQLDPAGSAPHVVYAAGAPPALLIRLATMPALVEAINAGEQLWTCIASDLAHLEPELHTTISSEEIGALVALPVTSHGERNGILVYVFGHEPAFDHDDRTFLLTTARMAAAALDRAMLFDAAWQARRAAEAATERLARLQAVTAALASALTTDEVARVAVEQSMATLGASAGLIALRTIDGEHLTVPYSASLEREDSTTPTELALAQRTPVAAAIRDNRPVWIESSDEMLRHFPDTRALTGHVEQQSWVALPLSLGERVLGGLFFGFNGSYRVAPDDQTLALTIAQQCAQALDRARYFNSEQRARLRLQQILDVLPETVAVADRQGQVVLANAASGDLLGRRLLHQMLPASAERTSQECRVLRPDGAAYQARDLPLARAIDHGETVRGEQFVIRQLSTGRDVPILVNAAPLVDETGERDGGVVSFQDITALKALEQAREEFLTAVSHDLKTPLTAILGHAQLLQRLLRKAQPPETTVLDDRVVNILRAASRMSNLLNDLLDHARLQTDIAHETTRLFVDLGSLLQQIAGEWRQTNPQYRFHVEVPDAPLIAEINPANLERSLENLLSNAVKYMPGGGLVTLSAHREEQGATRRAVVGVADQGIGIPAADLPHVFERFRRGRNVSSSIDGTGLGLANARQLIEQLGGTIGVASVEGEGTTVTIHLPLAPPDAEAT